MLNPMRDKEENAGTKKFTRRKVTARIREIHPTRANLGPLTGKI